MQKICYIWEKQEVRNRKMPKVLNAEKLFKKTRNSSSYIECWENAHNKRDLLITKWIDHIEKNTKKTRI